MRARLVDLTIYLGVDADKPNAAREPSMVKRRLASGHLHEMTAKGNGSLRVGPAAAGAAMMTILFSPSFTAPETF